MAATAGRNGSFRISTTKVGFIDTWQLTPTLATAEVTAFGDSAVKRVATLRDWSAQVSGTLDRSDASQASMLAQFESATLADISVRFYTTTAASKYWSGSMIVTQASIGSKVGDKVAVSFSGVADGALAWNT